MPEKFKFDDRHSVPTEIKHFIFAALAKLNDNKFDQIKEQGIASGEYEVSLTMNGIELPVATTLREIYRRFNDEVNERAAKLVQEKFGELDLFEEGLQQIRKEMNSKIRYVFGLSKNEDDEY